MSKSKSVLVAFIAILVVVIFVFYLEKPSAGVHKEKVIVVKKQDVLKKLINVNGMTCVGCEVTVEKALSNVKGVIKSKASFKDGSVVVEFDKAKTTLKQVKDTIAKKGYGVK